MAIERRQIIDTALRLKVGFLVAAATLLFLTSCETTKTEPVMTGRITQAKLRKQEPAQPVMPSVESQKLKDWIQL